MAKTKAESDRRVLEEKRFADDRARQAAEVKKLQEGLLARQREDEAKRQQDERAAAEKKAADTRARQEAEAKTAPANGSKRTRAIASGRSA